MPFQKKYYTEEERLKAHKESKKKADIKYVNSPKGKLNIEIAKKRQKINRKTKPLNFLWVTYGNMTKRVKGKTATRHIHLYKGLPLCTKNEFMEWAMDNKEFHRLFKIWVSNDNVLELCPSINRIDSLKGYTLNNMEWLTHAENSRLGLIARHSGGSIR